MTEAKGGDSKSSDADLLGIRISRATEHVIWIFLSVWLYLKAIPSYGSDGSWEGPISWFGSLWAETGLPWNPFIDVEAGVWVAFDSPWAVWLFILLSAGTSGLAVGRQERWGLRALSYLGMAAAVETASALWPVLASLGALGLIAVIAGVRCWLKDQDPRAADYLDYAPPQAVANRYLSDVALHYLLPLLGPLLLLLLTLQNFWAAPQYRPTDELLRGALRELHDSSDEPITRKDLIRVLEVFISLNGASRQETELLADWALIARKTPSGAVKAGKNREHARMRESQRP